MPRQLADLFIEPIYINIAPLGATHATQNKLVGACQGILACRYALSDPPKDIGELVNKLQSAIIAYEKEKG